jgi:hypothetical protein
MGITTEASERVAQAMNERLEKEVIGAWRAGYEYLHVHHPIQTTNYEPISKFTVRYKVLPSNQPAADPDGTYSYSFDLSDLNPELVARFR